MTMRSVSSGSTLKTPKPSWGMVLPSLSVSVGTVKVPPFVTGEWSVVLQTQGTTVVVPLRAYNVATTELYSPIVYSFHGARSLTQQEHWSRALGRV